MSTFIQIVLWLFCASTKYRYEEILSWDKQEEENHIQEILFIERRDIIVIRVLFNSNVYCAILWKFQVEDATDKNPTNWERLRSGLWQWNWKWSIIRQ